MIFSSAVFAKLTGSLPEPIATKKSSIVLALSTKAQFFAAGVPTEPRTASTVNLDRSSLPKALAYLRFPGTQPPSVAKASWNSLLKLSLSASLAKPRFLDLADIATFEPPANGWLSPLTVAGGEPK